MKYVAENFHGVCHLSALDADHISARTMLKDFPNSWVAIFPTYKSSNSGFGYIERRLPKVQKGFKSIALSPMMTFKILNGKMPRSIADLDHALLDIKGQFIVEKNGYLQNLICSIYDDVSKYTKGR